MCDMSPKLYQYGFKMAKAINAELPTKYRLLMIYTRNLLAYAECTPSQILYYSYFFVMVQLCLISVITHSD